MVRRKVLVGILAAIAVVGVPVLSCFIGMAVLSPFAPHVRVPEPSEITTPLDPAVVRDVCSSLGLADDYPPCKPGAVVYAPDFFPAIRRAFPEGRATREEVDSKLGVYRRKCEEPAYYPRLGITLVTCPYDLRGDGTYLVGITFTEKGVVDRVMFGGPGS